MKMDEVSLAYRAAEMYYINEMNQEQIAAELGLSRSKVSRLLTSARRLGMVKIELVGPESFDLSSLEREIVEKYAIREAHVVASIKGTDKEIKQRIALSFQKNLTKLLEGKRYIGLGWGTTVYEAVMSLPDNLARFPEMKIIPLLEVSDSRKRLIRSTTSSRKWPVLWERPLFFWPLPRFSTIRSS